MKHTLKSLIEMAKQERIEIDSAKKREAEIEEEIEVLQEEKGNLPIFNRFGMSKAHSLFCELVEAEMEKEG